VAKEQTQPEQPKAPRPNISILERRARGEGLRGSGAPPIQLKEDGWVCRWFNSDVKADHIWNAKAVLGWVNVVPSELLDPEQIGGFQTSPDGFVVRGEKGREVLLKMPAEFRKQIEMQKSKANIAAMDPHKQKADVANAAGKTFGDQAGEFINKNVNLIGNITTNKEVIRVTPEAS
jgi:hypothetical protein